MELTSPVGSCLVALGMKTEPTHRPRDGHLLARPLSFQARNRFHIQQTIQVEKDGVMMSPEITTAGLASSGMDVEAGTHSRRRRRTLAWLVFGLVGLIMGAVWAVGIATSTSTVDTAGATAAAQILGTSPPAAGASQYAGLVSENTPLTIGFTGTWGKVDADTPMFDIDLTAQSGTYFVAVYLNTNTAGWSALQLEFRQVNKSCTDATLGPADWVAPPRPTPTTPPDPAASPQGGPMLVAARDHPHAPP